jgi:parallel beta-helix repeat protein
LRAQTEEGYDYFNIRNSGGTVYAEMNGDNGASYSWTSTYTQRTAAFNFVSDDGVNKWGIDLYQIECVTSATTTTTIPSTTTTTRTTTTTTSSTTSTTQPQSSGPVIYLKFDESSGTTASDSSGGSINGALVNGPTWVSGRLGNALRLDGVNDYVNAGNAASLDITGPVTIMAWVNPSASQEICASGAEVEPGAVSKVDGASGSSGWSWQLRYGSPTNCALGFQFNDPAYGDTWVTVGQALSSNQWYHVAATFDGSTARSYLNGVVKESTAMSSIASYPSTKLIVGSDGWGGYFKGAVDDLRIYKRALSSTEINQIISSAGTTTTIVTTPSTTTTRTTTTTTRTTTTTSTTRITTTTTTTTRNTTTTSTTTTRSTTTTTPSGAIYAANYGVGSTTGDETQNNLNAIAAAAASSSKTLIYPAGKTTVITGFIRFPDGLIVNGNGCTIKRGNIGSHAGQMISLGSGGSGAEVYGLIYDGNSFGVHSAGDGIMLNDNSYFHHNEVKNVREYSVVVYGSDNVRISNNIIHDGLQYGICTGGGDEGGRSHNIVVTGNTIYNMMEVGIKIRGTTGATITGNTITMGDSPQSGGDTSSHHTTVRGISLYSFDHTNDNILIQDNTVSGPYEGYDGDAISSDDSRNTNIRIINNRLSKCSIGIDVRFTGGTITGNTMSDCSTCISGGSGNTMSGNTCT